VSLVSAPSRTSDIEKISTLGAHGAKGLHVLVVDDI
jgi:L-lactate utilization protein LutC